jgi:hypothetical protein
VGVVVFGVKAAAVGVKAAAVGVKAAAVGVKAVGLGVKAVGLGVKVVAVKVGIMPPGGATLEQAASEKHYLMKPPADGKGLSHFRFTRRRKEKLLFDPEDAGMTVYICARYENQKGDEGQWGPAAQAIIP